MITATQIISQVAGAPAQAGKKSAPDAGKLFQALYSIFSSAGKPEKESKTDKDAGTEDDQDSDPSPQAVTMELILALLQNACAPAAEDAEAPAAEGTAVADTLEGIGSSGGKDIASLLSALQDAAQGAGQAQGGEQEELMARMPQIMELLNGTDKNAAAETKASADGSPCPLESVSGAVCGTAGKPEASAQPADAEQGAFLQGVTLQGADAGSSARGETDTNGGEKSEAPETDQRRAQKTGGGTGAETAAVSEKLLSPQPQDLSAAETVRDSVANALEELEKIIASYDGQESKQVHLQLEPENLGKLSISLSMGRDGLTARIATQSAEVQSILSGQIDQLIGKLGSGGIQVQRMDVFCSGSGLQQNTDSSGGGYSGQPSGRRTGIAYRKTEPEEIETCGLYLQLEDSNSSVEYLI